MYSIVRARIAARSGTRGVQAESTAAFKALIPIGFDLHIDCSARPWSGGGPQRMLRCMRSILPFALLVVAGCGGSPTAPTSLESTEGFFESQGVRLSYALDLPEGRGPFPAVVLGHGSGRTTKDEARDLALRLVGRGFAVLRYDKRGVGLSGGSYSGVSLQNSTRMLPELAGDLQAAARFAAARPEIDARRVGLMGASQAGWIIPHAAAGAPEVAFVVLLSGPTVSIGQHFFFANLCADLSRPVEEAEAQLPSYDGPAGFDPRADLQAMTQPGLWLFGAEDRLVPARTSAAIVEGLAREGKPFRALVYPGASHNVQEADIWRDLDPWLMRFAR